MSASDLPLSYTEIEIRSYLPSGWNLAEGASSRWDAAAKQWTLDVLDGADNRWTIAVPAAAAAQEGRFAALKAAVDRLQRKALGRKSILTG